MSSLYCNFPFSWIYSSRACVADSLWLWASLFFVFFLPAAHGSDEYIKMIESLTLSCSKSEGQKSEISRCCRRCWKQGHLFFFLWFTVFLLGLGLLQKQMSVIDFNFTHAQGQCLNSNSGPLLYYMGLMRHSVPWFS